MKITSKELKKALTTAKKLVNKDCGIELLRYVHLEGLPELNVMKIESTTIHEWILYALPVDQVQDIDICIKPDMLLNLLPTSGMVDLWQDGNTLRVQCNGVTTTLQGFSSNDWPEPPMIDENGIEQHKDYPLSEVFSLLVDHASQRYEDKASLRTLLWDGPKNNLVATNGNTLAIFDFAFCWKSQKTLSLPLNVCNIISKEKSPSTWSMEFGTWAKDNTKQIAHFVKDNLLIIAFAVDDGSFPPYSQVLPLKFEYQITLDREDFTNKVKSLSTICKQGNRKLYFNGIESTMYTTAPEIGEAKVPLDSLTGNIPVEHVFDINSFIHCLDSIQGKEVIIRSNGVSSPIMITDSDETIRTLCVSLRY